MAAPTICRGQPERDRNNILEHPAVASIPSWRFSDARADVHFKHVATVIAPRQRRQWLFAVSPANDNRTS